MTTTPSNRDEDLLADLVARGLADLEAGRAVDPVALCGDQPHLAAELAAALGLQAALPELHARSLSDDPWLGRVLADRYELQAPLGRGAAGAVYRAHDRRLRRLVAIKLLHHGVFAGAAAEDRFLRESEVLAQHEHPHLLRIYDRGRTAAGELFLVTELLRGQGLQTLLEASRTACAGRPSAAAFARVDWLRPLLPAAELAPTWLQQIVRWIVQLGDGLAAAHRSSVFHRDVKPSNAFVRADGTAVLLDFGIAVRAGDPALTLQQAVVGTPWYMPPEQARGRRVRWLPWQWPV